MGLKMENKKYIVELDPGECWLSDGRGDPARTLRREYAKLYKSEHAATCALARAKRMFGSFRNFDRAVIVAA